MHYLWTPKPMKHESFKPPKIWVITSTNEGCGVLTVGSDAGHWKPLRPSTCFRSPRWTIIRPQRSWGLGLGTGFGWVGAFKVQLSDLKPELAVYTPENGPLEKEIPFGTIISRFYVKLWGCKGWIFAIPRSLWKGEFLPGVNWHIKTPGFCEWLDGIESMNKSPSHCSVW